MNVMLSLHFYKNDPIRISTYEDDRLEPWLTVACGSAYSAHIHLHPEAARRLALALLSQPLVVAVAEAAAHFRKEPTE